jgi:ferrous iron transport protein A
MTLKELKPGQKGIIESLGKQSSLRKRIIDMGLTIGTEIKVIKLAPLGDPIEIKVRGYQLSLRQNEASEIFVRLIA